MKNITIYESPKYKSGKYVPVGNGIYNQEETWFVSLSFEQEPDLGEGTSPQDISQYPLEDLLDQFSVYVSDFYEAENAASDRLCYLEFAGDSESDILKFCNIIGKHVFEQCNADGTEQLVIL